METNITNLTQSQIEEYRKLLEQKKKQADRAKEYREKNKEKSKMWSERARVRNLLLARKAKEMGITVTDDEIDDYLAGE